LEIIQELLNHGANLEISKESGWSIFIAAAQRGYLEVIRVLLEHALGENVLKFCVWERVKTAVEKGDTKSFRYELDRIGIKYFPTKSSQFSESLRK
jgi:ankyrin repeat protein